MALDEDGISTYASDWKIHDGRFYGKTRWEKKLSDHTFQRDCNAMVCGMDFSIVRWFSMVEEHPTYVVAGKSSQIVWVIGSTSFKLQT